MYQYEKAVYPMITSGLYKAPELTPDNLHPNDLGHEYVAGAVRSFLDRVYADIDNDEDEPALKAPITQNAYENSRLYQKMMLCIHLTALRRTGMRNRGCLIYIKMALRHLK